MSCFFGEHDTSIHPSAWKGYSAKFGCRILHSPGPTSTIVFGRSSATIGVLMTREAISTSAAVTVLGPYSQAIVAGGFVFCSGTAGIDPDTGEVREGVRAQTEQALTNLAAIL